MPESLKETPAGRESEYLLLLNYQSVLRTCRNKTAGTRMHILRNIHRLAKGTGMDPDQFMAFAKSNDPLDTMDRMEILSEPLKPGARITFMVDIRSFLHHNGFNNLPKGNLSYVLKDWHRAYRKEEVQKLLSYLDQPFQKLFVLMAIESGLRAQKVIDIKYGHVKEDLEAGLPEVAIRFGPEEYQRRKSAGFTFLGKRSVELIRELVAKGKIKTASDSPLIQTSYMANYLAVNIAKRKAGLDGRVQPAHGLRKYFEQALDKSDIDHDEKMVLEGHLAGTRAKHYTEREWETLRPLYKKAYPYIDVEAASQDPELAKEVQALKEQNTRQENELRELRESVKVYETLSPEEVQEIRRIIKESSAKKSD